MLVLARQKDQSIVIGDDIVVTVVDIRGDKVRLGINAPREVSVHRKEIYDLVRQKNQKPDGASQHSESKQASEAASPPPVHYGNGTDPFLKAAIEEARAGLAEGGLPTGSVLVRGGQVIGRGRNRRVQKNDPMAHAEIECLSNAGRQKTYKDTVLYSTIMPCHLCSGAIVQFGIPRIVIGESANSAGAPDLLKRHGVEFVNLHDPECTRMVAEFIKAHPDLWNEDIGK